MTLPLAPAPSLSTAARPYVPQPLPEPGPDHDVAQRAFMGTSVQERGPLWDRDARERELLGMAMAGEHGLSALRELNPREFALPVNERIAATILELADQGAPHDAATVTAVMTERDQLPRKLRPDGWGSHTDPRVTGLGAWQTLTLAPEQRAPILARDIRTLYRQDKLQELVRSAFQRYQAAVRLDPSGRLEADLLGQVTLDLADGLVSVPKELHPEFGMGRSQSSTNQPTPSADPELRLPRMPKLSPAGRAALKH